MEDGEIVSLYFARDERALKETADKYGKVCYRTAARIVTAEEAQECVNDTWLKTWNTIPPTRPVRLGAYVLKIVRNLALNVFEASKAEKRGGTMVQNCIEELENILPSSLSTEENVQAVYLRDAVERFLREQNKNARTMFVQRYWYMCSVEEIARMHGCTKSRVKMTLLRTREKLKAYLEKEGWNV